ncbi:hypothetical protein [Yeosuana sp.]|uniref:hypothetical protein n=1 Tax=Yeosuana sp. TaxID=2529388 RepID=UPI004049F79A
MVYKNIIHNIENVSDKQTSHLELAEKLSNIINLLKPNHVNKVILRYDGKKFYPLDGFLNTFLSNDINTAIKDDVENHKNFILKTVQDSFKDYDLGNKSSTSLENLKITTRAIFKYYCDYPLYSDNEDFRIFLSRLNESVEKELLKA